MRYYVILVLSFLVVLTGASGGHALNYNYSTIDMPGASWTFAQGINNFGHIVGFSYSGSSFIKNGNDYTIFSGGDPTFASGINDAGQIVGYLGNNLRGFLTTNGNDYTTITVPGEGFTEAKGINNLGQIVGFCGNLPATLGFVKTGNNYSTFAFPGADVTQAYGINNSGQIVGEYNYNEGAFLKSGNDYTTITVPGAGQTFAMGINNSGQIVGYFINGSQESLLQKSFWG